MSDKPEFDPSKPFEVATESAKPEFDPNAPFSVSSSNEPGAGEALLRGGAQGVSLGFADEVAGGLGALKEAAKKQTLSDAVKDYIKSRDEYRTGDSAAKSAHPYAYGGAQLAGGVASAFVPGLGLGKAATLGGRTLQAAKLGGVIGLGNSEADSVAGAAGDTLKGAALGGIIHPAIEGVVAPAISRLVSGRTAEDLAVRHLRPTPQLARALGPERLREVGREALDSGAIGFGQKAESTAANLADLSEASGAVKGDIVNNSSSKIDPFQVAENFDKRVIEPLRGTAENQELVAQLEAKKDAFLRQYHPTPESVPVPASQIEAEKMAVQNNINYKTDPTSKTDAMRGWGSVLKNSVEEAVNDPAFEASKRAFGNLRAGQEMAERTAGLSGGGTGLMGHITDVGVGTEALHLLANGNPAGLALGGARALTRGRLSSSLAVGADKLSKGLQSLPISSQGARNLQAGGTEGLVNVLTGRLQGSHAEKFLPAIKAAAARGDNSLATTHFILGQTNPEYQKAVQGE